MEDAAPTRDGRTLYFERMGSGSPIVVFEAGMGSSRNAWGAVVPYVAARTTTVVYDRAGLGRSAPGPEPRVLDRLVEDHLDLLAHLGGGPFVLVGHSWGGPIVRVAAVQVPDRIAGLVLVDQTDETCELFYGKGNERQTKWIAPIMPLLARTGVLRLSVRRFAAQLPEPSASGMRAEEYTPAATRTMVSELRGSIDDLRTLRDNPRSLPDVPVTVVTGMKSSRLERRHRVELLAAHRARADALPHGRHVEATRSSHYVPFTEPELIANEVLHIVEGVRS